MSTPLDPREEALVADLCELPEELGPPPGLDAAVLAGPASSRAPSRGSAPRGPWLLAGALAAALGLAVLWPDEAVEMALVEGRTVVDGEGTVHVGAVSVRVDGRASVAVEPAASLMREEGQEDEAMSAKLIAAALAGAALTVTVYEGSAWISGAEDEVVALEAGEHQRLRVPGDAVASTGAGQPERRVVRRTVGGSEGGGDADPYERIDELEGELEALRFEAAVAKGQLAREVGEPREWPADLPDGFQPESFRDYVEETVAQLDDAELLEVDCSEYPCLAVIQSTDPSADWVEGLSVLHQVPEGDASFGEGVSAMGMASVSDDGEGAPLKLYGFAMTPEEEGDGDGPDVRTHHRAQSLLQDLGQDMEEEGTEDVELSVGG